MGNVQRRVLKKLFSLSQDNRHFVINFLGVTLKIKYFFDPKMYLHFMNKEIKPKTILIIEFNNCHFETILGLCKYCTDLGYNVDVLTRGKAERIFQNIKLPNLRVFECSIKTFDKIYKTYDFSEYERILYNSKRIYFHNKKWSLDGFDLSEYYQQVKSGKKPNIYLQHHIDKYKDFQNDIQIILANPSKNAELENVVVNAHYFRKNIKRNNKNGITNFISIGELSTTRRNATLLIDSVKQLHSSGITNFKITIIGRGNLEKLPVEIQPYFNILGRVDYQTMFNEIEKADFILPLLDPTIKEHDRYKKDGTSGTFQLVYGFLKPCIIHKTFANIYDFTNADSIVYEDNSDLNLAMKNAIEINKNEYIILQENLKNKVEEIKNQSLENFERILND